MKVYYRATYQKRANFNCTFSHPQHVFKTQHEGSENPATDHCSKLEIPYGDTAWVSLTWTRQSLQYTLNLHFSVPTEEDRTAACTWRRMVKLSTIPDDGPLGPGVRFVITDSIGQHIAVVVGIRVEHPGFSCAVAHPSKPHGPDAACRVLGSLLSWWK